MTVDFTNTKNLTEAERKSIENSISTIAGTPYGSAPFIRNMGGAMASMYAMVAGFMTNIILDYLLVWKLPYGMAGAAAASFIGQGVTFWVCLIYLLQKKQKLLLPMRSECFLRSLTFGACVSIPCVNLIEKNVHGMHVCAVKHFFSNSDCKD